MASRFMLAILVLPGFVLGKLDIPTREVAPGIFMPIISIGTAGSIDPFTPENISVSVTNWLDQGASGIDTAVNYNNQEIIGKVLSHSSRDRKELFITSKVNGCESAKKTRQEVELALRQLNTSYIDLMLIHWRTFLFPSISLPSFLKPSCAASWGVLEDFHSKGLLRAIGVSSFGKGDLQDLAKTAKTVPAVNQVEWNVFYHNDGTAAFCEKQNITLQSYAPFHLYSLLNRRTISKEPRVTGIAAKHNISAYQVAGRWVIQAGHILTFASSKKSHQANSADIFDWKLTQDEMDVLNAVKNKHTSVVV